MFSAPLQTFCGAVVLHAQRAAYCVPFRFACAGNSCPAWFILSVFTAFATSGDALAGLSLLSILGRRSWIVSLAPPYMLFFCVSIFQRTSLLCGRKRCDPQELPRLGHNVLNKMASSRIFKALTDNCALSIVLSTSNVRSDLVKTRLSSQICGKFYQIITINLNQLQTVFLPKQ